MKGESCNFAAANKVFQRMNKYANTDYKLITRHAEDISGRMMYDILRLRQDIFLVEENMVYPDLDDIDLTAEHVMLYSLAASDRRLDGYARVYYDETERRIKIGRMAIRKECRRKGHGKAVMLEAIGVAGGKLGGSEVWLDAQIHAIPFYGKLGFKVASEEFIEAGIPHVSMVLNVVDAK